MGIKDSANQQENGPQKMPDLSLQKKELFRPDFAFDKHGNYDSNDKGRHDQCPISLWETEEMLHDIWQKEDEQNDDDLRRFDAECKFE